MSERRPAVRLHMILTADAAEELDELARDLGGLHRSDAVRVAIHALASRLRHGEDAFPATVRGRPPREPQ